MKTIEVLIVTRSVVLQQGLGALLESLPQISRVKATKDLQSAFTLIEEHQPRIVLLDETLLGNDPKPALEKIRSLSPDTSRILLADDVQKMELVITHAEAVCIKGISPDALASTVTNLLDSKGDQP
jgi:DNA-binding NarL/FixJ family response regulator